MRLSSPGIASGYSGKVSIELLGVAFVDWLVVVLDGLTPPIVKFVVELAAEVLADDCGDSARSGGKGLLKLPALVRRRKLLVLATGMPMVPAPEAGTPPAKAGPPAGAPLVTYGDEPKVCPAICSSSSSSSDTQRSQSNQPRNVPKLLQLTTETGDTRS